jgi:hypothetical protein
VHTSHHCKRHFLDHFIKPQHDGQYSGVKSVQAEAFSAVAAEERSLYRSVSDAAQMVAAIEAGNFSGADRDPLDCDSISDNEEGGGFNNRPSTGTLRTRPKTSGQTELPVEVRCRHLTCRTFHSLSFYRCTLLINFSAKLAASLRYTASNSQSALFLQLFRGGTLETTIGACSVSA